MKKIIILMFVTATILIASQCLGSTCRLSIRCMGNCGILTHVDDQIIEILCIGGYEFINVRTPHRGGVSTTQVKDDKGRYKKCTCPTR